MEVSEIAPSILSLHNPRVLDMRAGTLTRRGLTRVQRLAWTVADCAGVERPGPREADIALALRSVDATRSLPARAVRVAS